MGSPKAGAPVPASTAFSIATDTANAIAAAPTSRPRTNRLRSSSVLWDGGFSSAVWDRGVLIRSLLGLIGWVLPPSRMPAAGTSAPEPDSTWPLAQPCSCTFGQYTEHAGCLGWSDGHQRTPLAVGRTSTH